jgi:PKHD-type hydroxylase
MWHYIQRANRENFLYDLRCIDGESMQYTRYQEGQFYGWHNDAGLATQYKPVSVGNRQEGLHQDFVNENIELVRKLSFVMQLSDPDDYEGGNLQLLDEAGNSYIAPRQRGTVILSLDGLLAPVGSEVEHGRRNDRTATDGAGKAEQWNCLDSQ